MIQFIDAHCHFNRNYSCAPYGRVCCASDINDWAILINAAQMDNNIYPAIGIHPWNFSSVQDNWESDLYETLIQNPSVMVGEIGLDRMRGDWMTAYSGFLCQFKMAAELSRGVHLHCVRAWDEILHVFRTMKQPPVIMAHGFNGSPEIIKSALQLTGGRVFFSYKSAQTPHQRRAILATPIDRILVESDTDDPTLAADIIAATLTDIAQIHNMPISDMGKIIYNNTTRFINDGQVA